MRKFIWFAVLLFALVTQGFSQATFTAVNNGNWNATNVWSLDGVTPIVCAPCVAGVDYPGALDDAFTNQRIITLTPGAICKNLAVSYNTPGGLAGTALLTITGTLGGWDDAGGLPTAPLVNVFAAATPNLRFTAANLDGSNPFIFLVGDELIAFWNKNSPLGNTAFQITKNCAIDAGDIFNGGDSELQFSLVNISGGTALNPLRITSGSNITGIRVGTTFTVGTNTTFASQVPVYGLTPTLSTSRLTGLNINGTIETTSFINSTTITIGSAGVLNTSFNGADQTQGWWYQSNTPTTFTLNAGSTITFSHEGNQNVPTRVYSNLILDGAGTKTLNGVTAFTVNNLSILTDVTLTSLVATARNISGNLVVDGIWQPSLTVFFNGTTTQTISGGGTLSFNGGMSKTAASTLTFNKALTANGITVAAGSLNLGDFTTTLSGGNFSMTGSVTSGTSGTLVVPSTSVFSGAGSLTLNNLSISGTGAATINNSAWSITGNLVNSGTLTLPATSTVTFTGGATQAISGNAFSIGNMTVNKTASSLYNQGVVELLGTLTMTTGTFDADGLPAGTGGSGVFTINSDTNGDARIGAMAGGSIVGNVTFERYFDNTSNRWRNLGFPVTGVTHTALQTSFPIHLNSLSYYLEATAGDVNQGWTYVNSGTLTSTRGHSAWMYNLGAITVSVRGPLLKSTPANAGSPYNFGVTYTNNVPGAPDAHDGWNFIPNPFASAIDWDNSGWVKTNVNGAAAIWDIEANMYRYTDAGWDGVIAAGQAFWVQTNAASPVLTCQESVKVSDTDPIFYRQAAIEDKLLVKLKSAVSEDIAAIRFREDATLEFDTEYDASKLSNPIFNLSSLTQEGLSLAVNNLPKSPCASTVFLNVTNIEPGAYTLKFDGLNSFNGLTSLVLVDHFANTKTTLADNSSYAFEVSSEKASYGSSRFELSFTFEEVAIEPLTISRQDNVLQSNYAEGKFQWFWNGKVIEGATEASYQAKGNGDYTLELIYKGCPLRSESISVEGISRVYPNPVSSGDVQIQVADLVPDGISSGKIIITSPFGVAVKEISFNQDDLVKVIDMRDVRPGQYIVSISTKTKIVERVKLIVQ